MRKLIGLAVLGALGVSLSSPVLADPSTRQRIARYFEDWYSFVPGSRVSVAETKEIAVPELEAYRVERHSQSKAHQESNIALYDRARDEVFVGDVFYDPDRAAARRSFEPARDLPNVRTSLGEAFGLPVRLELDDRARGVLRPLTVSIDQQKNAFATRPGFVSADGAALMLGEFHPLSETASAFRARLLSDSASRVPSYSAKQRSAAQHERPASPAFIVTEFVDFQCERCKKRTPEARAAGAERGGVLEIRFLPLVKQHDWAFAAAESGAALAALAPELFERYVEAVFERQEKMSAAAARELAADIAEAAGVKEKFAAELGSGRARDRVLADITLAVRLGITGTPSFLEGGTFISGEFGLLESYLSERFPATPRSASPGGRP